jgi:hypothetical protein
MVRRVQSFILFFLGILLGAFCYWLASISFFSRVESSTKNFRIIASSNEVDDQLRDCSQIKNITNKDNIDIYCSFNTQKRDHGVKYRVKSVVRITKDNTSKNAVISITNKIKDKTDHITEADYCDCETKTTVDLANIEGLEEVSQVLINQATNALQKEGDRIEDAVEDAYDLHQKKERLESRIAKCEISDKSTVNDIKEIEPEEKINCRAKQLENIEDKEERAKFFHSDVKPDLWYLASQEEPLDSSLFLSDYMRELNNPSLFFDQDYFSVRSAIDTIQKYNDLRLFMHDLGDYKLAALNNISMQLPFYFYTTDNPAGRQDRLLLERAWNRNFQERPFPAYYSLASRSTSRRSSSRADRPTNRSSNGISAQQFRTIVNSPEFQRLYRK